MVARPLRFVDRCAHGAHRPSGAPADEPLRDTLKQRLAVVAPNTAEAVRFVGGWLFDQVMEGWDATVFRADEDDERPLQIIGARGGALEQAMAAPPRGARRQAIAVHTELYHHDPRIRRMVLDALDQRSAAVSLWGDLRTAGGAEPPCSVRYRLSAAARAFKAQALAAAAVAVGAEDPVERFVHIEPLRFNPI
ncbi:hypothetical protein [Actinomadura rugatobispora]|uniref:Uncharacterized protein n=1 Tax=Actinomadura rugatobispora TaxID=1994 RepID=A0ABW1A049_9ACTN|nr:hypothetical protein GCM10010200_106660 [Actinomadura rugatobispora]